MRDLHVRRQSGASLIEVLVAMVVLAIGLLGLVGLQAKLQVVQVESYQRAQALLLLNDMSGRIMLNRSAAASYVTVDPLGFGEDPCPTTVATRAEADIAEWCNAIFGAAETNGGGANVGAMVGGRGCVQVLGPPANQEYLVTVAWQGLAPLDAPPASVDCGVNEYGAAGTPCAGDVCRRVVTTIVRIADLT
jgi:type IV pilus assembly protein PilV